MNERFSLLSTFLTACGGLLAAMGGWEFVKYLLNRKSNSRIGAAQAFEIEYKALIEDYKRVQSEVDKSKEQIEILNKKVDGLYEKVHQLESDKLQLIQENNALKLELKEAEKHVCMQPDDKCLRRLPQPVQCRLRTILAGGYIQDHPDAIITDEDMMKTDNNNNEKKED